MFFSTTHVEGAHPERVDQPPPRRRELGRGGLGVELLEVVVAEALDERVLGVLLHPPRLVEQERLPGEVRGGQREAGPAAPAAAPYDVRGRVGGGEGEQVRRELGGQPAGGERRDARRGSRGPAGSRWR